MIGCGITEKKLNNRRFKKTEEKILKVFFEGECKCICKLAKKAGIARTTVYFHHHRVSGIPSDYQHYILYIYKKTLKRIADKEDAKIETVFEITLLFMMQNKKLFEVALYTGDSTVYRKMIELLRPLIERGVGLPKNSKRMFNVYVVEVVELLDEWSKNGFKEEEMKGLLKNIMYLTKSLRTRLSPIMEN